MRSRRDRCHVAKGLRDRSFHSPTSLALLMSMLLVTGSEMIVLTIKTYLHAFKRRGWKLLKIERTSAVDDVTFHSMMLVSSLLDHAIAREYEDGIPSRERVGS